MEEEGGGRNKHTNTHTKKTAAFRDAMHGGKHAFDAQKDLKNHENVECNNENMNTNVYKA